MPQSRITDPPRPPPLSTGARILPVSSLEDVKSILRSGQRMRATCSTRANASSSRSHSLLLVAIKTTDHATHLHTSGRLILVRHHRDPYMWTA